MTDETSPEPDEATPPAVVEEEGPSEPRPVPDTADEEAPSADEDVGPAEAEGPDWEELAEEDPRSGAELLAELTAATSARDEYLDALQRARAEFDNYRKRMMREASTQREAGKAEVAGALLDVLDDFDRTLEAADSSQDDGLAKGVELVHGKLMDALKAMGLARIDEAGVTFDPKRHEAVQQREADESRDEPVVTEVLRPGYEMAGRVIRAAMVVVEQ